MSKRKVTLRDASAPGTLLFDIVGGIDATVVVTTWADGYGNWHTRFLHTGSERLNIAVARAAVGHEIGLRQSPYRYRFSVSRRFARSGLPGDVHYSETDPR